MKRSDIRNAYDTMTPTSTQKDEMFRRIMENAPKQSIKAGKYQSHSQRTSFLSLIPAVAALFVVILAGVFVIGRPVSGPMSVTREPVDAYAEIPQLKATKEWQEYLSSYTGTAEDDIICHHATWGCRNHEMADKFDEICTAYNLTIRDYEERMTDSVDFLLEEVALEGVFAEGTSHETGSCAYWSDGQFYIAGSAEVNGSESVSYLLHKTRPDVWLSEYMQIITDDTLDCWRYVHSSGSRMTIGMGETVSFLYAPIGDEAFFVLVSEMKSAVSKDALEDLAETFSFSLLKPTESAAIPVVYMELINLCKEAIKHSGWDEAKCDDFNISPRLVASRDYAAANAGYQILDIDGNGTPELIIGHENYIWNLYTLEGENTAVQIINDTNDGTVYDLHEGGRIVKELTTKEEGWHDCYLFNGISLEQETSIYGKDRDYFDILAGGEPISSQEALDRIDRYDRVDLELTLFYDVLDSVQQNLEAVEHYTPVIEKYKTAMLENWSWEKCDQNDISRQIMYATTNHNNLGWTLVDLDNNGVEELIVSDGTQLFDLYTMMPTDGLPGHILAGEEYNYTLCKDSTIERRISNGGFTYWSWFRMTNIDYAEEMKLILDNTTHQYSISLNGQDPTSITENEAGAYITAEEKKPMELVLVPFAEQEQTVVREANYYYEPIIELYRKAIVESWDPGKCIENGISLMIGYYGELYEELGHNQIDLNGDNIAELIITDGTNIFDIYTVIVDEEVGAMRYALESTERNQYFMIDEQTLYCRGSGGAALTAHTTLGVGQRELYVQDGFLFDASDADGPWFFYQDETKGSAYPDAENIVNSWKSMAIPFIPFGDGGMVKTGEQSEWEQAKQKAFDIIAAEEEFGYGEYIAWLIPWREQEFENPRPLYYYLQDVNGDGIADLILGYEDEVTAVWSYLFDEKAGEEHLTLLNLSTQQWSELDESWLTWDIRPIENFLRNE